MSLAEIRARIEAAPTSSAGDPDWLADAKVLLAALDARGEPVAWRVKDFGGGWIYYRNHQAAQQAAESTGAAIQGLFPPTEAQSKQGDA